MIPATDPGFTYIGRWPQLTVNSQIIKAAINGGPRIRFAFTGTSLVLNFINNVAYANPEIEYTIDGGAWTRTIAVADINAATSLSAGSHTCEIIAAGIRYTGAKWADARDGICFYGVTLDGGAIISPWPTGFTPKILVVGDSIGEGESLYAGQNAYPPVNDARNSWPYLIGQSLHADVWVHAFGGMSSWGVFDGYLPQIQNAYPYKMSNIVHTDPAFDVIIMEGIQNEYNVVNPGNGTTSSALRINMQILIDRMKADQPNALIYLWTPLVQWPTDGVSHDARVADIIYLASVNNLNVLHLDTLNPLGGVWGPTLNHPNLLNHQLIANYISPLINLPPPPTPPTPPPTTTENVDNVEVFTNGAYVSASLIEVYSGGKWNQGTISIL